MELNVINRANPGEIVSIISGSGETQKIDIETSDTIAKQSQIDVETPDTIGESPYENATHKVASGVIHG